MEDINLFFTDFLDKIVRHIETNKSPHLSQNLYESINFYRDTMYQNKLDNYSIIFDINSKYHYQFETDVKIISERYPNRIMEYDINKGSRSVYKLIPHEYSLHDVVDMITYNDIPRLSNELYKNQDMFIQLKNGINNILSPPVETS